MEMLQNATAIDTRMLQMNSPIVNCAWIVGNSKSPLKVIKPMGRGGGGGRGEDFQQYLPFVCTEKALESGHPRDEKMVSVTIQAGRL